MLRAPQSGQNLPIPALEEGGGALNDHRVMQTPGLLGRPDGSSLNYAIISSLQPTELLGDE